MKQTYFTIGQAAKEIKKSKATISRYIKSGKLSATKQDDSSYQIQAAELFRVFPENVTDGTPNNETGVTDKNSSEIERLQLELKYKDDKVTGLVKQVDDLQEDRNHWRQQATNLLTHHKRGWLDKLLGRG